MPSNDGLDSKSSCHGCGAARDLPAEPALGMDEPQRSVHTVVHKPPEKWRGVAAGRREDRHDMAWVGRLDVVT